MGWVRMIAALLAAVAVLAVLISPAPDELPGTTPHFDHYASVFASFLLSVPQLVTCLSAGLASPVLALKRTLDLLTLECTRLC